MSANVGHLSWMSGPSYSTLKGDHIKTIHANFELNLLTVFRGEDFSNVFFYSPTSVDRGILDRGGSYWA